MTVNIPEDKEFYKTNNNYFMPHRITGSHPGKIAKNKCERSNYSYKINICSAPIEGTTIMRLFENQLKTSSQNQKEDGR